MPTGLNTSVERDKLKADTRLREQELAIQRAELKLKKYELRASRWTHPLVLAVLAAALAAFGNAAVALINGSAQRQQELTRNQAQENLERIKAEAARILEVIKPSDQEQVRKNLSFLLKSGLIEDGNRHTNLAASLAEFLRTSSPQDAPSTSQSFAFSSGSSPLALKVNQNPTTSVEGDWILIEKETQIGASGAYQLSRDILHLDGQSEITGTLSSEDIPSSSNSVRGFYRNGRLSLSYANTNPSRFGFGTVVLTALPSPPNQPIFAGILIGTHLIGDLDKGPNEIGLLACPVVLAKKEQVTPDTLKAIPAINCSR